ncbi:MAG: TIGR02444 family protein [Candidatus Nanopelagicales bacterium]
MALYAHDGVPDACLHLQNRHDLDVPVVLFAAFVGAVRHQTLTASGVEAARARVDAWHREVVRPLRAVRQRLKTGPAPAPNDSTARLRGQVQKIEIEAELIELDQLDALIPDLEPLPASGSAAECAAAAIETVIKGYSHIELDDLDRRAIETIAGAVSHQV